MFVIRAVPTEALTSLRVKTETNSVLVHTLLPEIPCGQEPSWSRGQLPALSFWIWISVFTVGVRLEGWAAGV